MKEFEEKYFEKTAGKNYYADKMDDRLKFVPSKFLVEENPHEISFQEYV